MPRISIVIPVFDAGAFLEEAVERVRAQTFADWELLLFDDGSRDGSREVAARLAARDARLRCLAHPGHANRGQFATRVAAAGEARAGVVAMLDQDDVWDVDYLAKHLARWQEVAPRGVQLSYGPGFYWHPDAPEKDYVQPMPPGTPGVFAPPTLLSAFFEGQFAATPLPSTTFIRRDALRAAGRFGELARGSQCEDQYLCWFIGMRWPVAIYAEPWVKYRQHPGSALAKMLATPARANRAEAAFLETARREVARLYPEHPLITQGVLDARLAELGAPVDEAPSGRLGQLRRAIARASGLAPSSPVREAARMVGARSRLAVGVAPLSEAFGEDRGTPLTRHYVAQFLRDHAADVRGRCLEFEGDDYTRAYGGDRVTESDVLDLYPTNPNATVVADLTAPNELPSDAYDAIVCTFVLHEIFDMRRAVAELYRVLKPGGVMLVAVPHVTMCEPAYGERWRFTVQGLTELLAEAFPSETTTLRAYGNSLTAAAQLRGLVAEEMTEAELSFHDPRFAVILCARVMKPLDAEATVPARREAAAPERAPRPSPARLPGHAPAGQGIVLLYHRTASETQDPHLLAVDPARFEEHLRVIQELGRPAPLLELGAAMDRGEVPERSIAVTFDDGYVDNLLYAKPALVRRGVPATVFVTAGYVGAQRELWWDAVERLFLRTPRLPETLELDLGARRLPLSLGRDAAWTDVELERHAGWHVLEPESPTARHLAFREALERLRPLPEPTRRGAIASLFAQAELDEDVRPSHRVMDVGEVRALADGGTITVGAHTVTHSQLSALDRDAQRHEIAASRARLEAILDRPVETFAYPFGSRADYDARSVELVHEQGFALACSNFPGLVTPETPRAELPRVMVMDWSAEELARHLEAAFAGQAWASA